MVDFSVHFYEFREGKFILLLEDFLENLGSHSDFIHIKHYLELIFEFPHRQLTVQYKCLISRIQSVKLKPRKIVLLFKLWYIVSKKSSFVLKLVLFKNFIKLKVLKLALFWLFRTTMTIMTLFNLIFPFGIKKIFSWWTSCFPKPIINKTLFILWVILSCDIFFISFHEIIFLFEDAYLFRDVALIALKA